VLLSLLLAGAPLLASAQPDAEPAPRPLPIPSVDLAPEARPETEAGAPDPVAAEAAEAAAPASPGAEPDAGAADLDLLELFRYGGPIGYVITALSVVMLALALRFAIDLRPGRLTPARLGDEVSALLRAGRLDEARARLAESDSLLAEVTGAGLAELPFGREDVASAMAAAADHGLARTARRIELLNVIATVAPMLGLLGTVTGMVRTFATLAASAGPVEPGRLAGGIFEALITTVLGLGVAIPAVLLFALFRNRADELGGQALVEAERLVGEAASAQAPRLASEARR
jgi:biopolymer transport protein ExbB